ncbi:MAG: error-prone DNA polymerase, partial [Pedobacter sp.]
NLLHVKSSADLPSIADGRLLKIAGLVLVRQRPGTAGGVCFITIEDENGFSNLVVFQHLFEKYRKEILQSRLLMVEGKLQREGEVVHIIVQKCFDYTKLLKNLTVKDDDQLPLLTLSRADEKSAPYTSENKRSQVREVAPQEIFSGGRNFR